MTYTPQFHEEEQTPAQRWEAVRWAIGAGASDSRVPSQDLARLELRYVAGDIDQVQVHDELMRWYWPDVAPAADVRPLPPEPPDRVYPYAAEMAELLHVLSQLPPPQPYINVTNLVPQLAELTPEEAKECFSLLLPLKK